MKLNLRPPFSAQKKILREILSPDGSAVKKIDVHAGRGWGKSVLGILAAVGALLKTPGTVGLFLEPNWDRVRRVFLQKWRQIVPSHAYNIHFGNNCITMFNGSELYFRPRNISGNQDDAADNQRGPEPAFVIDDEAAIKCSRNFYINTLASVRLPASIRFYLTVSTFQFGEYELIIDSPSHYLHECPTEQNPYLPEGWLEEVRAEMSPEVAARELDAKRTRPEGHIWKYFEFKPYPEGHIFKGVHFDPAGAWWLAGDIGGHASYGIWQQINDTMVLVEEWTINNEMIFTELVECFVDRYCGGHADNNPPQCVYLGSDSQSSEKITGNSPSYILGAIGWHIKYPTGPLIRKQIQHDILQNAIYNKRIGIAGEADNVGQFHTTCHYGAGKKRGALEVMRRDKYSDAVGSEIFVKDKTTANAKNSIEDDRDMLLYFAAMHFGKGGLIDEFA